MTEMNNIFEPRAVPVGKFIASLLLAPIAPFAPFLVVAGLAALVGATQGAALIFMLCAITLVVGGGFYLLIGTPMLIWHLRRNVPDVGNITMLALMAQLWLVPLTALAALATLSFEPFGALIGIMLMGCFLGPLWGACFALIYKRLTYC